MPHHAAQPVAGPDPPGMIIRDGLLKSGKNGLIERQMLINWSSKPKD
jgi:hypothetical protein